MVEVNVWQPPTLSCPYHVCVRLLAVALSHVELSLTCGPAYHLALLTVGRQHEQLPQKALLPEAPILRSVLQTATLPLPLPTPLYAFSVCVTTCI